VPSVNRVHRLGITFVVSTALALGVAAPADALLGLGLNASTQSAANVTSSAATLKGQVSPLSLSTAYYFQIGTSTSYGTQTPTTYVTSLLSAQGVQANVTGLKPSTTYHYRIVASELLNTVRGSDMTFKTAVASSTSGSGTAGSTDSGSTTGGSDSSGIALPGEDGSATDAPASTSDFPTDFETTVGVPPVLGNTIAAAPAAGAVSVRLAGSKMFVPLEGPAALPVGSEVDARAGTVNLVTALDTAATTQAAQFQGAVFRVGQGDRNGGITDLYLRGGDFRPCWPKRVRGISAARAHRHTIRRLWGRDRGGRFRTHGTRAVATVRGTTWSVADRCDGTVTTVTDGAVSVYDRGTRRNVLVNAGHSYLARTRR
jgi:hypothetical protein